MWSENWQGGCHGNVLKQTVPGTSGPVPDMTYNVFSGSLNPTQSINQSYERAGRNRKCPVIDDGQTRVTDSQW